MLKKKMLEMIKETNVSPRNTTPASDFLIVCNSIQLNSIRFSINSVYSILAVIFVVDNKHGIPYVIYS